MSRLHHSNGCPEEFFSEPRGPLLSRGADIRTRWGGVDVKVLLARCSPFALLGPALSHWPWGNERGYKIFIFVMIILIIFEIEVAGAQEPNHLINSVGGYTRLL